jgi:hypothetical protein
VGTIQWQYSTTSSSSDFIDIYQENGLTYSANDLQQTTWFRVANESGTCSPVYSTAVKVIVNPNTTPTFNQVAAICNGASLLSLPTTSTNGIKGTWLPVLNNTLTTTYTFTPTSVGCVNIAKMTITVNERETPTFAPVAGICSGVFLSALPTISSNGISGTWLPALSNTVTKTYTFTPTDGVCANTTTMTITVNTTAAPIGDVNQRFNMNASKTISDLVAIGSNIRWYTSIENALANTTPLELSTILVMGNTYYAMQTINGCSSTNPLAVKTYVDVNLGITDLDFKGLQFYPNPIADYFTVIYTETITSLQLFNTIGQSVFKVFPNAFQTSLNINFLPSGVYYVEVKANNNKGLLKVIKK